MSSGEVYEAVGEIDHHCDEHHQKVSCETHRTKAEDNLLEVDAPDNYGKWHCLSSSFSKIDVVFDEPEMYWYCTNSTSIVDPAAVGIVSECCRNDSVIYVYRKALLAD